MAVPKMKPGKYVNHNFTADQKHARMLWRQSDEQIVEINNALKIITWGTTREAMHERLDARLDTILKRQERAKGLFPDVENSFTIASMTMPI